MQMAISARQELKRARQHGRQGGEQVAQRAHAVAAAALALRPDVDLGREAVHRGRRLGRHVLEELVVQREVELDEICARGRTVRLTFIRFYFLSNIK